MRIGEFEQGLQNRIALVTGAAVGNGRAMCERLAQEGARIVIADIADASDTVRAVEATGGTALALQADLTQASQVQKVVDTIMERYGRLDILVHNVGIYEEEPFELLSFDQWQRMLNVTLNSLFLTTKAVLPPMKENGFGRIIVLSSNTVWLGTPYLVHYVTCKMGMIGFVRSLAAEVGKYGITVNAITVGLTATQMPNSDNERISKSLLEHILPTQCVRRPDEPEDVANIVAFLALPASGMITGQTINVDGGIARH